MKLIFTSIFSLLAASAFSQQVVASAGETFSANGTQFSSTVGEPITATFTSGNLTLTQGMQQPDDSEIIISVESHELMGVNLWPNPSEGRITLSTPVDSGSMTLSDVRGKLLFSAQLNANTHYLNFSHLPVGSYFLRITTDEGYSVQQVQIIR